MSALAQPQPADLNIRLATVDDAADIQAVMLEAYEEYRNTETPSSALQETVDYVAGLLRDGKESAIVSVSGETVVATVRFHREDGLYFSRLAVRPICQGRGIAKSLLAWLEDYARQQGEARIWCRVRKSVPRNLHLYHSLGFEITDEWMATRKDGRQMLVVAMAKKL